MTNNKLATSMRLAYGVAGLAFATAALPAWAQQSPDPTQPSGAQAQGAAEDEQSTSPSGETDGGKIVVTARKREERLRDIPLAASVMDVEQIENRAAVADTGAIVTSTPGARFNDITSSALSEVSLRSSGTARATNAETGVGLYANGVYVGGGLQFSRNFTKIDFFDLGRAEVLRGTLGALYGRNAVGGAINLIAQQPVFEDTGRVFIDYAPETEKKLVSLVSNHALGDTFAVRFGAEYVDQPKGLYHQYNIDRYSDAQDGWILRGQARWREGPVDLTTLLQYSDLGIGGGFVSLTARAGTGCPATPATACYLRNYFQTPYEAPFNTPSMARQGVTQAVVTLNYDLDWAELSSVTSVRRRATNLLNDSDFLDPQTQALLRANGTITGGANQRTDSYMTTKDVTFTYYNDTHLGGESGALTWLAGLEFLRIGSQFSSRQVTAAPNGTEGYNRLHYISVAPYGSVGWDLNEQLNLSAELRYTDDEKNFSSLTYAFPSYAVTLPVTTTPFSGDNWSYNLVANWRFASDWIGYGKVGTGYRAGGFNSGVAPPPPAMPPRPLERTFDNEESLTYEVGAKGNLLRDLYVTLAAYQTTVEGAITQVDNGCFIGNPQCNTRVTNFAINGGEADLWGVEFEGVLRYDFEAAGHGSLRGSVSRQEGQFQEGPYNGLAVPQSPDWAFSGNLEYRLPLGSFEAFSNINYRGQRGGVESVTAGSATPRPLSDFDVFDVRAGVRFDATEFAAYVNNATDDQYTLLDSGNTVRWSPPLSWGLQLRYRW